MTYEQLLDRLEGVRRNGSTAMARCPAHEDNTPSLSIRPIEGQMLLYCHAGCDTRDILAALNIGWADLFDNPKGVDYRYSDGRIVHRTPTKRFRQSGNTNSTPQLYRLQQVREAVAAGHNVWLVEGEKDVHALESLGIVATTAPMGAVNVTKCDLTPLHEANLVIIPDQDAAGQRWLSDVLTTLDGNTASITIGLPLVGKDAADHIAAGHGLTDFKRVDHTGQPPPRRIVTTAAVDIPPRRVHWAWDGRIALGTLALLAGPEGLGKSTLAYWFAARITRGELPGEYAGQPRAVLVCATEDSWAHTIVPRLMAAGADLRLIYRVEVKSADDITLGLSLPKDLHDLDQAIQQTGAVLLILDPLMSRISEDLDTHRDGDVRRALEPMVGIADHTGMAIIGLIHHNKSGSTDPLQLVMASKAFTAVARSVHTVIKDPDDETETRRLFGTPKNNLGRIDLPVMSFMISGWSYDTAEGPGSTGQLHWGEDVAYTIAEALRRGSDDPENRTLVDEAADWLSDYLHVNAPKAAAAVIHAAAKQAGHSYNTLARARRKLKVQVENEGFPRVTYWSLPVVPISRGDGTTGTTGMTGQTGQDSGVVVSLNAPNTPSAQNGQSYQSYQSYQPPARAKPQDKPDTPCCGNPLHHHAAPDCTTPVIYRPPDLWSVS